MMIFEDINIYRGNNHVIKNLSLKIKTGEICSIVGANGAGKSTLMMAIAGLLPIASGQASLQLDDEKLDLRNDSAEKRVKSGLSLCPEGRQVFGKLTIDENLTLGAYSNKNNSEVRKLKEKFYSLFPILDERKNQKAGLLSGGEQMMLALSRALMSEPSWLLLDEPSLGLAPKITDEIFQIIIDINKNNNLSIILVEQNAMRALAISHYGLVLKQGEIVLAGDGKSILENKDLKSAYLGN